MDSNDESTTIEAADGLMSSSVSTNLGQQKLLLEKLVIFVFCIF